MSGRAECRAGNERMSESVTAAGLVFLSGQVAPAAGGTFEAEAAAALAALAAALARAGSGVENLVHVTVYLSDLGRIEAFNSVWDGWIGADTLPARVAIQTPMVDPARRVAVGCIALPAD